MWKKTLFWLNFATVKGLTTIFDRVFSSFMYTFFLNFPLEPTEKAWQREPGAEKTHFFALRILFIQWGINETITKLSWKFEENRTSGRFYISNKKKNIINGIHYTQPVSTSISFLYLSIQRETANFPLLYFWKRWHPAWRPLLKIPDCFLWRSQLDQEGCRWKKRKGKTKWI